MHWGSVNQYSRIAVKHVATFRSVVVRCEHRKCACRQICENLVVICADELALRFKLRANLRPVLRPSSYAAILLRRRQSGAIRRGGRVLDWPPLQAVTAMLVTRSGDVVLGLCKRVNETFLLCTSLRCRNCLYCNKYERRRSLQSLALNTPSQRHQLCPRVRPRCSYGNTLD